MHPYKKQAGESADRAVKRADGGSVKGNKGGLTKDQQRYGDIAQPKHLNEWAFREDRSDEPSRGRYPMKGDDEGSSSTEKDTFPTRTRKCGGAVKKRDSGGALSPQDEAAERQQQRGQQGSGSGSLAASMLGASAQQQRANQDAYAAEDAAARLSRPYRASGGAVKKRDVGGPVMPGQMDPQMALGVPQQLPSLSAMPMRKRGGSIKMDAGAGSGVGRLEQSSFMKRKGS